MMRAIKTGIASAAGNMLQKEPRAIGMAKMNRAAPAYFGWRTRAYGPVEIRRCPASMVILEAANVFFAPHDEEETEGRNYDDLLHSGATQRAVRIASGARAARDRAE